MKLKDRSTARRISRRHYLEALESRELMSTVLAGWNTVGDTGVTASPFTAQTVDSALNAAPGLTRDTGLTATSLSKGFASSGWTLNGGPINGGASTTDLFFDMTVKAGDQMSLSEFDMNYRATSTGPHNAELDYSLNGGSSYTVINTAIGGAGFTTTSSFQSISPVDLSGISALQNLAAGTTVQFRIVPYGGTGATGTFAIFNNGGAIGAETDLAVMGTSGPAVNAAQTLSFSNANYTVDEDAGTATFQVLRTGSDLNGTETVNYAFTDGTAVNGTNYTGTNGTLTFTGAGDTSENITVPISEVQPQGGDKTFSIILNGANLTGGTAGVTTAIGTPSTAAVTISDDADFALSYPTIAVNENLAGGVAYFSVSRSGDTSSAATAIYSTSDGTALAGTNYTATTGTINFAAGQSVASATVPILDAGAMGGNKTFTITVGQSTSQVTIVDTSALVNNLAGVITSTTDIETGGPYGTGYAPVDGASDYGSYEVLEFSKASTPGLYPTLGNSVSSIQDLSLELYNTATTGTYAGHPGSFNVYFIPDDDTTTPTSSLVFNTADPTGLDGQADTGPGTLLGTFSFNNTSGNDTYTTASIPAAVATELMNDLNNGQNFRLAVTPGTAAFEADWDGIYPGHTPNIAMSVTQSAVSNGETFSLGGFNDAAGAGYTVNENAGSVTVTVNRSGTLNTDDSATIDYSTSDGSALAGTNYTGATSVEVDFAAGVSSATFSIPITDAANMLGDKAFTVTLSNPGVSPSGSAVALGQASATVNIVDSYDTPGNTAVLSSISDDNATVEPNGPYATSYFNVAGTSTAYPSFGVLDFNTMSEFTPATPIAAINTMTLQLTQGSPPEGTSGPMNVYLVPDTTTNIDASSPESQNPLFFDTTDVEGIGSQLSIDKANDLLGSFVWDASTAGATPVSIQLTDYSLATEQTLIADLNSGIKFRLVITPENSSVDGSFEGNGDFLNPQIAFNVTDAAQLAFSSATYSANETDGTATITVNRGTSSVGAVSVNYATTDGTALAGIDYTTTSGTLNFADGQSSATFTIPLTDVNTIAGTKMLNITLSNPNAYAVLGAQTTATLTIADNAGVGATAPTIASTTVGDGTAQRSTVQSFTVSFNEAVNFNSSSFSVFQEGLNADGSLSGSSTDVSGGFTASSTDGGFTWTVSVIAGGSMDRSTDGSLKDGVYQVVLHGDAITDAATGTANFNSGSDRILSFNSVEAGGPSNYFHALYGDIDGNGVVNANDLRKFEAASGASIGDPTYVSALDFDGNGVINANDLRKFEANSGISFTY